MGYNSPSASHLRWSWACGTLLRVRWSSMCGILVAAVLATLIVSACGSIGEPTSGAVKCTKAGDCIDPQACYDGRCYSPDDLPQGACGSGDSCPICQYCLSYDHRCHNNAACESPCGNGACEPPFGENCTTCPVDCGACKPIVDGGVDSGLDSGIDSGIDSGLDDGGCGNIESDPDNCGACGFKCDLPNVTDRGCVDGTCTVESCMESYADCNGVASDGCEANVETDTANCGYCGLLCNLPNVMTPGCANGKCTVAGGCEPGHEDCDGNDDDGCESLVAIDVKNCGSCGHDCTVACAANVAVQNCVGGACGIQSCAQDFYDVDNICSNGCECPRSSNVNSICTLPAWLGTIAVGSAATVAANLVPTGTSAWYSAMFTGNVSAGFHPHVWLDFNSEFVFDVRSNCNGIGSLCQKRSDGMLPVSDGLMDWDVSDTDANPYNAGQYEPPNLSLVYIHVYRKNGALTTCDDFTLHVTNDCGNNCGGGQDAGAQDSGGQDGGGMANCSNGTCGQGQNDCASCPVECPCTAGAVCVHEKTGIGTCEMIDSGSVGGDDGGLAGGEDGGKVSCYANTGAPCDENCPCLPGDQIALTCVNGTCCYPNMASCILDDDCCGGKCVGLICGDALDGGPEADGGGGCLCPDQSLCPMGDMSQCPMQCACPDASHTACPMGDMSQCPMPCTCPDASHTACPMGDMSQCPMQCACPDANHTPCPMDDMNLCCKLTGESCASTADCCDALRCSCGTCTDGEVFKKSHETCNNDGDCCPGAGPCGCDKTCGSDACCTPNCTNVPCNGSNGCNGTCSNNCCTPDCANAPCGGSDGCDGTCSNNCCIPDCSDGSGSDDQCGDICP